MIIKLIENGVPTLYETDANISTVKNEFNFSYSIQEFIKNINDCGKYIRKVESLVSTNLNFDE